MIEFSRGLARRFRAVLRKCAALHGRREVPEPVIFSAERDGLRIQSRTSQAVLEFFQPGTFEPGMIAVPGEILADVEGKQDAPVRLVENESGGLALWQDQVVPRSRQYDAVKAERLPKIPALPGRLEHQPANFLRALEDAAKTTAAESVRFATSSIQLRGRAGEIVATDGRQLLLQSGFTFPWKDDVLIPALAVFGCRDFEDPVVEVGRIDKIVSFKVGPWTLHLAINDVGRFPNCERIVPNATETASVVRLEADDSRFLLQALPSLPGGDEQDAPVTVCANGEVVVRAKSGTQPNPTDVVLTRSAGHGRPLSFASNRAFVERALRLGFGSINVYAAGQPIVCREGNRTYLWQALAKSAILAGNPDAVRLLSNQAATAKIEPVAAPLPVRAEPAHVNGTAHQSEASLQVRNGTHRTETPKGSGNGLAELITEAEALKDLLRDAYTRTTQLLVGAKRYRKQAQVVKTTLASLRQLQHVEA
jgi:hypothetical protein